VLARATICSPFKVPIPWLRRFVLAILSHSRDNALAAYPKTATNLVVRLAFGQSAFGPNIAEVPHYSKVFTGRGKQRVVSDCSLSVTWNQSLRLASGAYLRAFPVTKKRISSGLLDTVCTPACQFGSALMGYLRTAVLKHSVRSIHQSPIPAGGALELTPQGRGFNGSYRGKSLSCRRR
jgi:hypothetical protein